MDEQNRKKSETAIKDNEPQTTWELDFEAAQQFAREAMERKYTHFYD